MSDFWFYFQVGLNHVLDWQAYDHVLFLIVLSVPYMFKSWQRVLLLVTLFTIGHTVSMLLNVYNVVSVNAGVVEFLIPITIFIGALFNVFTAGKAAQKERVGVLFIIALFFGLIHGLGFSNFFKGLTAHLDSKLLPLLEFALGIEAAQIIVVFVVLILNFIFQSLFRFSKRDWVIFISSIVIGLVLPMVWENYLW